MYACLNYQLVLIIIVQDEMALEVQDNFERVYNFRFEEPGSSEVRLFIIMHHFL